MSKLRWTKGATASEYHAHDNGRHYEVHRVYDVDPRAYDGIWRLIVRAHATPELAEASFDSPRTRAEAIRLAEIYRRQGNAMITVDIDKVIAEVESPKEAGSYGAEHSDW